MPPLMLFQWKVSTSAFAGAFDAQFTVSGLIVYWVMRTLLPFGCGELLPPPLTGAGVAVTVTVTVGVGTGVGALLPEPLDEFVEAAFG